MLLLLQNKTHLTLLLSHVRHLHFILLLLRYNLALARLLRSLCSFLIHLHIMQSQFCLEFLNLLLM